MGSHRTNLKSNYSKAGMASAAGKNIAPKANWPGILCDAASEVFSMMVGSQFTLPAGTESPLVANVTGTVGIAGALRAVFSLRCSAQTAAKIASRMLAIPLEAAASQSCDAIGEICNMVAGSFKAKVGLEAECMLSVPTVITGSDYRVHSLAEGERLEIPILYDGELILIALDIRK